MYAVPEIFVALLQAFLVLIQAHQHFVYCLIILYVTIIQFLTNPTVLL